MGVEYGLLTYNGDVSDDGMLGQLFGWDEFFKPYEVLGFEVSPRTSEPVCLVCKRQDLHTHVYLQYARPETMKSQGDAYAKACRIRGLL